MGHKRRELKHTQSARQDHRSVKHRVVLPRVVGADRRSLLAGTALASTLLIAVITAPTPASAVVTCAGDVGTGPLSISHLGVSDSIVCVNTEARTNAAGNAIELTTINDDQPITLTTSGTLSATNPASDANGIYTVTNGGGSHIDITSSGDIIAGSVGGDAFGIYALAEGGQSAIDIVTSGDIIAGSVGGDAFGIYALAEQNDGTIDVDNRGAITVNASASAFGIRTNTSGSETSTFIVNSGDIEVTAGGKGFGIFGYGYNYQSSIDVNNSGDIAVSAVASGFGIYASTKYDEASTNVNNSGDIEVRAGGNGYGIHASTYDSDAHISVANSGDIVVASTGGDASGIKTFTYDDIASTSIINSGGLTVTSSGAGSAFGIYAFAYNDDAPLSIDNSGDISVSGGVAAVGIGAYTYVGFADTSPIDITNSGAISVNSAGSAIGIDAFAVAASVRIENSGSISARGGMSAIGINAYSPTDTTIVNSGTISASSDLAIDVTGTGFANLFNSGTITGFVDLTEQDDMFINQAGGVFEAKLTSFFGAGNDLFSNETGGTVQAATRGGMSETSSFEGLERFENRGTISMVDGAEGDSFTIANTPGGSDLEFVASGNSRLAVDASLGGPGSTSDTLTIEGNVSGQTEITVNNTNAGPGSLNRAGIPVVFATGATPDAGGFFLDAPIDAGFFEYDLFFVPTGSGRWELRSSLGGGSQVLPQLITASQDIWYQGSSVWFDRSADLRVVLAGGNAPAAGLGSKSLGAPGPADFTPAVWVRGSGGWLDRDGDSNFTSFGRSVSVELDRDLETIDFQMGLDLGTRDLLSQGDILVFGMLGGFVHGDLDYNSINRNFDYDGGQVGAYATYLKGGLFVDTLFNAHIYELGANGALGYPNDELDATTLGLRTDAGYRFGSFSGGTFLEPLATIAVTWADIDGFSLGGNTVRFDSDANVRGRLGLRAGTTVDVWDSTIMEPFVIGSLWGHLAGDNQATLVSGGQTFRLEDNFEDVWGEVSAGVNFFNFSKTTSLFAKVDVTFGDDVSGVGGKAGMRVAW